MADQSKKPALKHPLIIYRFMTRRYRPAGILLVVVGVIALLPTLIPQLRFQSAVLNYSQLGIIAIAAVILGLVIFVVAVLAERQAYVQCLPEYLVIHTLLHRVFVAYQRVNSVQPVQIGRMFDIKADKKTAGKNAMTSRDKELIKPLLGEGAIEVEMSSWPMPEKKLRKTFNRFMFSTREQGFVFIVPKPQTLSIELTTYMQQALDKRDSDQQRYLDPIERLKYQNNKTF